MYAFTKFATVDKDFVFLECLLFGALISATDPGTDLVKFWKWWLLNNCI